MMINHKLLAGGFVAALVGMLIMSAPASKKNSLQLPSAQATRSQPTPPLPNSVPTSNLPHATTPASSIETTEVQVPVLLPGQPEPAGIQRGFTEHRLAGRSGLSWTLVASEALSTPTASFSTRPSPTLQSITPTSGQIRDGWIAWFQVDNDGNYSIGARMEAGPANPVKVFIDGQDIPAIQTTRTCGGFMPCDGADTALAGVALAKGWHEVTVDVTTHARDEPIAVSLNIRAPADSMPVAMVPYSLPPKAGKAVAGLR